MKIFLIILITVLLTSCSTTNSNLDWQRMPVTLDTDILNFPELETITEKSLGDTLVVKGIQTKGPAYRIVKTILMKEIDLSELLCGMPGCPYVSLDINQEAFVEFTDIVTNKSDGTIATAECAGPFNSFSSTINGTIKANMRTGSHYICLGNDGKYRVTNRYSNRNAMPGTISKDSIERTIKTVVSEASFKQELIYNGRLGDGLKFIYREFSGDMARPAFTQDIQYDLKTSNIIGFKNVKLEVISATNTVIKYKVISNF
tara:strand:- start:406 stop:1182 length:777 start_codon:yes stop_codon:yes gene_type:complete